MFFINLYISIPPPVQIKFIIVPKRPSTPPTPRSIYWFAYIINVMTSRPEGLH